MNNKEQKAFEDILKDNPYDEATRKVYADWLDEHDMIELANKQRSWTPKYQKSVDWMTNLANKHGVLYRDLIQAGYYKWYTQYGSTTLQDMNGNEDKLREFFDHWEVITGEAVNNDEWKEMTFSCSC